MSIQVVGQGNARSLLVNGQYLEPSSPLQQIKHRCSRFAAEKPNKGMKALTGASPSDSGVEPWKATAMQEAASPAASSQSRMTRAAPQAMLQILKTQMVAHKARVTQLAARCRAGGAEVYHQLRQTL